MSSEESLNCVQIQGPEYVIRSSGSDLSRWDLYLLKVVNKGKENQRYEFKIAGYSMRFETCLKHIINYRVKIRSRNLGKGGDEDLKKLMKIWMEEKTKLLSILELGDEEWSKLTCLKRIPLEQLKQRDLIEAEIAQVDDDDEEDNEEENNED